MRRINQTGRQDKAILPTERGGSGRIKKLGKEKVHNSAKTAMDYFVAGGGFHNKEGFQTAPSRRRSEDSLHGFVRGKKRGNAGGA